MNSRWSGFTIVQTAYRPADHLGDRFEILPESSVDCLINQSATTCDFEQRHAFLGGTTRDGEEVFSIRLREAAVAFSQIRRDREGRTVQLAGHETEAAREVSNHLEGSGL